MLKRNILLFFEFLILGLGVGVVEDLLAVFLATDAQFSLNLLVIIFLVALPFALLGELVVDKIDIPYLGTKTEIFLEFLVFGFVVGIIEDMIAITLTTGEPITFKILLIIGAVTLPFALFSELIVDRLKILPSQKIK